MKTISVVIACVSALLELLSLALRSWFPYAAVMLPVVLVLARLTVADRMDTWRRRHVSSAMVQMDESLD